MGLHAVSWIGRKVSLIAWMSNYQDIFWWPALLGFMWIFYVSMLYGSPMNWWRAFFGTHVIIDTNALMKRKISQDPTYNISKFSKEVHDWMSEMGIRRFYEANHRHYIFLYKGDAARFKMAWWCV